MRFGEGVEHEEERGRAFAHQFHVGLAHEAVGEFHGHRRDDLGGALAHQQATAAADAGRQHQRRAQ